MSENLRDIERRARFLQREGKLSEAISLFMQILRVNEGWEHGLCCFEVASCYEELGNTAMAYQYFKRSLAFEPESDLFLSGLASFLYVHGTPSEAFDTHLELVGLLARHRSDDRLSVARTALQELGKKLGMSDVQVSDAFQKACRIV